MTPPRLGHPNLGLGVGLRSTHFDYILANQPEVDWFEVISENFIDSQGRPRHVLRQIAERYAVVLHGVSLSIGATDPLNLEYLRKLKTLAREVGARWISDHLCWTGVLGRNSHDLLPIPFTEKTLRHVVERVRIVQFHLAGHSNYTKYIIDTHDNHVIDPVWELYRTSHHLTGGVSTLLEWDANIPPFPVVHQEVLKAKQFMGEHLAPATPSASATAPASSASAISEPVPEAVLAGPGHGETVFHPLHQLLPEVE